MDQQHSNIVRSPAVSVNVLYMSVPADATICQLSHNHAFLPIVTKGKLIVKTCHLTQEREAWFCIPLSSHPLLLST